MKVLIFGSKGFMGQHFLQAYPEAAAPSVDIADPTAVAAALDEHKPDVVINCSGKTGKPNVDWCEDHKEETIRSNVHGPLVLLDECSTRKIYWVQLSTGCIYEGDNGGKGFTEGDTPNFSGSFYARSKMWIDQMLREFPVLQLRLRMPFDDSDHDRSLITKLSKYPKVLDAENSITYVPDFIDAAKVLIQKRATGTYNVVNPGVITPYRIMEMYQEIADPKHTFDKLSLEDLPGETKAGRSNCVLSDAKLKDEGVEMRDVEEAVSDALHKRAS